MLLSRTLAHVYCMSGKESEAGGCDERLHMIQQFVLTHSISTLMW
jgi:hypothetical protein